MYLPFPLPPHPPPLCVVLCSNQTKLRLAAYRCSDISASCNITSGAYNQSINKQLVHKLVWLYKTILYMEVFVLLTGLYKHYPKWWPVQLAIGTVCSLTVREPGIVKSGIWLRLRISSVDN